jgi:lipoprotein-releasing system permease protein
MLGVATLIIVMAVMNGFRNRAARARSSALNGHILVQPLERPADRLEGRRRPHQRRQGHHGSRQPVVDGQALASSPFGASGVFVRGIRAADLNNLTSIAQNIKQGSLEGL